MGSELRDLSGLRITPLDYDYEEEDGKEELSMEEADDDEEDEDVNAAEVTLGFAEKPGNPGMLQRHLFPSKAGGAPAWLDPVDLPVVKSGSCGFCCEPLQFLLQIYAPISDKDSTFHRMLYVFMCPSMSCLLRDQHEQWRRGDQRRSVKVFRCQLPRSNPYYSSEPPKRDGKDEPSTAGASLCCWCGTWKGDKFCSNCKTTPYCSANHQSMHWRSQHKTECFQTQSSLKQAVFGVINGKEKLPGKQKFACSTLWPEYEIIIEDECAFDKEFSEDNNSNTSLVCKGNNIDETYHHFSEKFGADKDKNVWVSFQERIAKAPEQVLRYCRDSFAKPLWPLSVGQPSVADIPKCNYCKGPLCYEFQIMPQLLYYFGVKNDVDSLDWGTIVVYTCSDSCDASVSYKEEFAWVQLYPSAPMNL